MSLSAFLLNLNIDWLGCYRAGSKEELSEMDKEKKIQLLEARLRLLEGRTEEEFRFVTLLSRFSFLVAKFSVLFNDRIKLLQQKLQTALKAAFRLVKI